MNDFNKVKNDAVARLDKINKHGSMDDIIQQGKISKMLSVGKPDIKKTKSMISDKSFNINNS